MAERLIMPKLDMTMVEGTLGKWYKQEGDHVTKGDVVFEVEADKANIDIEATADGVLRGIAYPSGSKLAVGTVLAYIVAPGEQWTPEQAQPAAAPEAAAAPAPTAAAAEAAAPAAAVEEDGRVRATPAARRKARELGVSLEGVKGTGENGCIVADDVVAPAAFRATPVARKAAAELGVALDQVQGSGIGGKVMWADVQAASAAVAAAGATSAVTDAPAPSAVPASAAPVRVPLKGARAVIARRMTESYLTSPHVTLTMEADMTEVTRLRKRLNAAPGVKISIGTIVAFLVGKALAKFPQVNSTWDGSDLLQHSATHLAIAVDTPTGLVVPVVKDAQLLGISGLGAEVARLAEKAREGKLMPADMSGGTFTISNLGMMGIEAFTPIINPPQVAILGVGAVIDKVVPFEGQIVVRPRMALSLSLDHRAMDGADGGRFLAYVRDLLENPERAML